MINEAPSPAELEQLRAVANTLLEVVERLERLARELKNPSHAKTTAQLTYHYAQLALRWLEILLGRQAHTTKQREKTRDEI